ncbi:MAG: anti-sigma factor family protein [Terriglobia bacterium]
MTCETFDNIVDDLARGGFCDEEAAGLEHVKTCPACARRLAEAQTLTLALQQVSGTWEPKEAPPELEKSLRIRFRQRRNLTRWQRRKRQWAMGTIAAGILLVIGLSIWFARPSAARRYSSPAMEGPHEPAKPSPSRAVPPLAPSAPVEAENRQPAGTSDFLPLPDAEGAPPATEEQVVRITLPASALQEIGFPVSGQPTSRYVTADILIGEDGIARAIRIVQ